MPEIIIPLAGAINSRSAYDASNIVAGTSRDQYFKDCVFDVVKNPLTKTATVYVMALPTLITNPDSNPGAASSTGTAICIWTGKSGSPVLTAYGGTNSVIWENGTSRGTITGVVTFFSETSISGTANFLAVADSNRVWFYPDGGSLTEITDSDFPSKQTPARTVVGNFVHMDGYAFIMCSDGTLWNSDLNSLSSWTSTNFITAQRSPDSGIGLARYRDYIVAFGSYSTEFFVNAGNPTGSVLSRLPNASLTFGAINAASIVQYGDTVAWINASGNEAPGVYVLDGFSSKKISSPSIDKFIALFPQSSLALNVGIANGKYLLFIGLTSAGEYMRFVFDKDSGMWTACAISMAQSALRITSNTPQTVVISRGISTFYQVFADYNAAATTAWSAFTMDVYAPTKNRKFRFYKSLAALCDSPKNVSSYNATIASSDDDGATFGTARTMTVGATPPIIFRLGSSRKRMWRITIPAVTDYSPPRWHALVLDYDESSI